MKQKTDYNPLYFLSALGSGGIAISIFMYLQFMIPHPKTPMVKFEHIIQTLTTSNLNAILVGFAVLAIIYFGINHYVLLIKNLFWLKYYKTTKAYKTSKYSVQDISFMAIPLTLAMSINVIFVFGSLFIPKIWDSIELLFPITIIGFLSIGIWAASMFGKQMIYFIINGDKSFLDNNNLSQLIAPFTFTMISVGFAAAGAMSNEIIINSTGIFFAILFLTMAAGVGLIKFIFGFKAMFEHGISKESSPTFWLIIPILTLGGITVIRLLFGLNHHYGDELSESSLFVVSSIIISIQLLSGVFGYSIMRKIGYFKDYIFGDKKSSGSFSLICPGIAFFVFGMFFIHFGLVKNGIVEKFGILYFTVLIPFAYIQIRTIILFFKLSAKLLK